MSLNLFDQNAHGRYVKNKLLILGEMVSLIEKSCYSERYVKKCITIRINCTNYHIFFCCSALGVGQVLSVEGAGGGGRGQSRKGDTPRRH